MAKDLFSKQSQLYAKYRPTYPKELFDHILQYVTERDKAWDCATGNGQAANVLADYFKKVEATDISQEQLNNAVYKPNIEYRLCPAEKTPFENNSFDLITIATAYHWINHKAFYEEATRVGKPDAVVAAWAYNLIICEDENVNQIVHHLYYDIVYDYWDKERRHVENDYSTIAFDFCPLPSKGFDIELIWTKEQFMGYLQTWSALQNYVKKNGSSPLSLVEDDLNKIWNNEERKRVQFPLFLKIGRIIK